MATITLRAAKGSPLTNAEVDANFSNINAELATKANASSLASVATSGSYTDLTNKPTIPTAVSQLTNDSGFVTAAGARSAISVTGSLSYNAVTGVISYTAPTLATVATTGAYADLTGKPTIPSTTTDIAEGTNLYFTNARARSAISASGSLSYNSTTGVLSYTTPNSDGIAEGATNLYFTNARARSAISVSGSLAYNSTTGVISYTAPTLATVATTGAYADLTGRPTIPTAVSQLTNDSGFITTAGARSAISVTGSLAYNSTTGVISFTDAVTSVAGKTGAVTLTGADVGLGNVENKSSATIRSEITSGNVTTALGYTPANRAGDTFTGLVTVSGTGLSAAVRLSNTIGGRDLRVMQKDDGRFVITDETAGAERFAINSSGNVFAYTDLRAPIFYDSNNTAYYVDPASSTILAGWARIDLATGASSTEDGRGFVINGSYTNGQYSTRLRKWDDGGGLPLYIQQTTGTAGSWSNVASFGASNSRFHFHVDGTIYTGSDVRGSLFYDSNDTSFYVDPNGGSRVNTFGIVTEVTYPGSMDADYASGYYHFGPGNATPTGGYGHAHIIRLDSSWNVQMFFPTSNTNEPFWIRRRQSGTYSSWRRMLQEDEWIGSKYFASDGRLYGTILYDSNDTNYYVDPTGPTQLSQVYANNWFRPQGQTGLYFQDYGGGFHMTDTTWVRVYNSKSFLVDNTIWSTSNVRAPVFYNSNDTNARLEANSLILRGTSPTVYFRDTDNNSAMIHCNSNLLYVLRGGIDTESWSQVNGQWPLMINLTNNDITVGGNLTAVGNVTAYSDARLKKDVETISGALDLVSAMRGVRYTRVDNDKRGVGVIAQEMLEVVPEAVQQGVGDDDTLSVAYGNLIGVLIEAIKELRNEVRDVKSRLH